MQGKVVHFKFYDHTSFHFAYYFRDFKESMLQTLLCLLWTMLHIFIQHSLFSSSMKRCQHSSFLRSSDKMLTRAQQTRCNPVSPAMLLLGLNHNLVTICIKGGFLVCRCSIFFLLYISIFNYKILQQGKANGGWGRGAPPGGYLSEKIPLLSEFL